MVPFKKIKVDKLYDGQVWWITLNVPKGNVLDREMMLEIEDSARSARIPSVKALVFEGAGDHFSFGASVAEHTKEAAPSMLAAFHQLFRTLIDSSKPLVAVVRGQCLGGGMELATFCHWVFASENAMFGQPEIQLGVFPPVASIVLPAKVGQAAADDLILTGRSIPAREAKEIGLITSVSGDPKAEATNLLDKQILPKSGAALEFTVKASRYEFHEAFRRGIERLEKTYVRELMETADANEGIASFLEKRKPAWKNR
ncbi:MAG TPA: enoyl-CoA hydratase-related protein [Bdellovibrionota bacterium]|nr:enoyl-CoA hydratase-related protein [Bdellovibrionota bacterium]